MRKMNKRNSYVFLFIFSCFFSSALPAFAGIPLFDHENFILNFIPYFRGDVVTLKNNNSLDTRNKDDSTTYFGIDYSLGFDLKSKKSGPEAYLKLERNGPYDYDAPLFIRNTLLTSSGSIGKYRNKELLPHIEEFWYDTAVFKSPFRAKGGLFVYQAGNNIAVPASYENYSFNLYNEKDNLQWHFYYCRPDLVNKSYLGPRIKQEREQGIHYTPNKANFFATDAVFNFDSNSLQPYVSFLVDHSGEKRGNLFSTPTDDDLLGTLGMAWNSTIDKLSLAVEAARNFGRARSSNGEFKSVEHCGYLLYLDASYDLAKITPHSRFTLASGNKVNPEMAGDETFNSGKNRAFSTYSPFNTNFLDSLYPDPYSLPFVAMGFGNGLNYGINRPSTFGDPQLLENLLLYNLGFNYQLMEKLSLTFDWWYLQSMERGVGTFEGESKKLSADLGNELDLSLDYALNKNITLSLLGGYFFPGKYYREDRDDSEGSLFTPFVRGDGEANGAYQIEFSLTLAY